MITFIVSASKMNVMDACWQRYDYEYNQMWTPNKKPPALEDGDLIHRMFAYFYREQMRGRLRKEEDFGILLDEATNAARRAVPEMDISIADGDEIIKVGRANLIYHRGDGLSIHAIEEPFSKVLYEDPNMVLDPKDPGFRILFEGRTDLIGELPNQPISVWDHKSESRRSTPSTLSNQFEGMAWAFGVESVIVNKVGFQTSLAEKDKFRRIWLDYRPPSLLLAEWRRDTISKILEAVQRHKNETAGRPYWPRNRTSCDKYSGCWFKQVCEQQPALRPVKLMTYFHKKDPTELYSDVREDQTVGVEE